MSFAIWALIAGAILIAMALLGTLVERLPLSPGMIYLAIGYALGPAGFAIMAPDPQRYSVELEKVAEVALLISLFAVGLKLGVPLRDRRWYLPLRLAFPSMALTVLFVTVAGALLFGLPAGAALLLAAILAPTDPVLASDVQVEDSSDRDRLRFSLTAEGGLNDGTAFPFVMLGLSLLGLHEFGAGGWRWLAVDVVWAIAGGVAIGGALGVLIGKVVLYLRTRHREALGLDEFLSLGLIAIAYGVAQLCVASGFLAVFAAGLALQRIKGRAKPGDPSSTAKVKLVLDAESEKKLATDTELAGAYMMEAVQGFNGQLERLAELMVVMVVGAMLSYTYVPSGSALVPARPLPAGASGIRMARPVAGGERIARPAPADFLVRHPRRRLRLLPHVRPQSRFAGVVGSGIDRDHAHDGRRVDHPPRHLGDAAHEWLREAQGDAASLSGDTRLHARGFHVNPATAGNSYARDRATKFRDSLIRRALRVSDGKICHGTWFARTRARDRRKRF